ncbi:hypothetical protein SANTM175S_01288 [Streptomyces antimycoticus]
MSGAVSWRSTASIRLSWRVVRLLTRRPTLPNISPTLRRLSTCRSSSAAAVTCTWLNASARSPISSRTGTGIGRGRSGVLSVASSSSSSTLASSSPATSTTWRAAPVRAARGRTTERRTRKEKVSQAAKPRRARASSASALCSASRERPSARSAIWPISERAISRRASACRVPAAISVRNCRGDWPCKLLGSIWSSANRSSMPFSSEFRSMPSRRRTWSGPAILEKRSDCSS